MEKLLPGSTVEVGAFTPDCAATLLKHVFSGGGIMMSQVCTLTGLEPYMVQNWVKRGFVSKPNRKTYDIDQLCRIFIINMLRDAMQIDEIVGLLSYINGALDDTSDDRLADSVLYNLFVNLLGVLGDTAGEGRIAEASVSVIPSTLDPTTRRYAIDVLGIMACAYYSAQLRQTALRALRGLDR